MRGCAGCGVNHDYPRLLSFDAGFGATMTEDWPGRDLVLSNRARDLVATVENT
jgi:hypothetical protein